MRHKRSAIIQLAVLAALGVAVLLTLLLPQAASRRSVQPPLELSVILREADSSVWSNVRLGMEQAAGELRAELRFLTLSRDNDSQEQEQLLLREAEGGADALVVVPADRSLAERREELVGQLPLVSVESPAGESVVTVAPDNQALGRALGQAVAEDWEEGVVLLLQTAPGSEGVSQRLSAARLLLEEEGVPVETAELAAEEIGESLLRLLVETGAQQIVTFEPSATEQAAAAKEEGTLPQLLYGVGLTSRIAAALERGTVSASAAWSDFAAGYLAVEGAVSAARGETYQVQPLPFAVLRGEDIYEPDNQKRFFPVTT